MRKKRHGMSYRKRVADINMIYDRYSRLGVPNREIWLRYIYPKYAISERTFYNLLKASADPKKELPNNELYLFDFNDSQAIAKQ